MDMSKYKAMFVSESREQLARMDSAASGLRENPEDRELIDHFFRQAHSIKGMAASMDYNEVAELAHALEDLMSGFREGERVLDKEVIDLLFEGIDELSAQVDARADDAAPRQASALCRRLSKYVPSGSTTAEKHAAVQSPGETGTVAGPPETAPEPPAAPDGWDVEFSLSVSGRMAGLRAFLVYKRLESVATVYATEPELAVLKSGDFAGAVRMRLSGSSEEEIGGVLGAVSEVAEWKVWPVTPEPLAPESEIEPEEEEVDAPKMQSPLRRETTVRISTSFLDYFINVVGELSILHARLDELAQRREDDELGNLSHRLDTQIRDIYSQVMNVRLMPLETVTSIFPRTVRELARKHDREIRFEMRGQDIEVDRSILEVVFDPLLHLLRNAVDHGIELPNDREAVDKPRQGHIRLSARREREKTVIELADDGRGLDPDVLRRKAVEKGMLGADAAERLSDHEALQLICMPGFSTAAEVTETSGRGVGMDAVKTAMEKVGGTLDIFSTKGEGTRFKLTLPRSVAILPVLLAGVGSEVFAFPLSRIGRTLSASLDDIQRTRGRRYFQVDNRSVPVVSLSRLLKVPGAESAARRRLDHDGVLNLILVEREAGAVAVEVDEFLGHVEAFIKPLSRPLEHISCLGGVTVLGSGRPVFVIEANALTAAETA